MMYTLHYDSPLGGILLAADDVGLTGLWFDGERYFAEGLDPDHTAQKTPILQQAERWLEVYFSGREPGFTPPLHPMGSPFRQAVWELLLQIPYGQTTTYGALAKQLAEKQGIAQRWKEAKTAGKLQTISLAADGWTIETKETGTEAFAASAETIA